MISHLLWISLLILQCGIVTPRSILGARERVDQTHLKYDYEAQNKPKEENSKEEQVISVRITSSIAVGRNKPNYKKTFDNKHDVKEIIYNTPPTEFFDTTTIKNEVETVMTEIPPNLIGANIEYIRQLNAKKDARSHHHLGQIHPMQWSSQNSNETETPVEKSFIIDGAAENKQEKNFSIPSSFQSPIQQYHPDEDSLAEPSIKAVMGIDDKGYDYDNLKHLPLVRSMLQEDKIDGINSNPNFEQLHEDKTKPKASDNNNNNNDAVAASSLQSISTIRHGNESDENIENIPLARSLPFSPSSKNYIQGLTNRPPSERGNSPSLTTVSFNIVHDTPKQPADYNAQSNIHTNTNQGLDNPNKFYEPPMVYSQPAKVYSEPAKFYSEPAKVYSEPAKVYSEPAKVYSEPAKVYGEPAKFYSPPASLHLTPEVFPNYTPWKDLTQNTDGPSTIISTPPTTVNTVPPEADVRRYPEKNYEVDEKVSVLTDGRSHGVQETTTEKCKQDNCKVGYVVEGRQYKKYRVEERTPDGFIVGEYGVVRNEDGALRGVRYTADSDASPRLIYDALMKFLQLK